MSRPPEDIIGEMKAIVNALELEMNQLLAGLQRARELINTIERHCPCGARPESLHTYPHTQNCPVHELKKVLEKMVA